ncbi:MAG TPA: hypothetical protein VF733_02045 [Candidatus Saccharimonadales bacterium]
MAKQNTTPELPHPTKNFPNPNKLLEQADKLEESISTYRLWGAMGLAGAATGVLLMANVLYLPASVIEDDKKRGFIEGAIEFGSVFLAAGGVYGLSIARRDRRRADGLREHAATTQEQITRAEEARAKAPALPALPTEVTINAAAYKLGDMETTTALIVTSKVLADALAINNVDLTGLQQLAPHQQGPMQLPSAE